MYTVAGSFNEVVLRLTLLLAHAPVVDVGEWQAIRKGLPQERTIEVEDVSFEMPIPGDSIELLQALVKPNLPWAEEHFGERVSGVPYNPPPSHVRWPFAQRDNAAHLTDTQFSHTYPERIWPTMLDPEPEGVRFPMGDLQDLVQLLKLRPGSRQAYLPIWFPEDLYAATHDARVPCTLGYHFLIRNGRLKIVYYIRSCDFYRHFRDDVYMAARLAQWVATKLDSTVPAKLVMHISSLHIFEPERERVLIEAESLGDLYDRKKFSARQ